MDEGERVYTIDDFYDAPRSGVADYCGQPHVYQCLWNEEKDYWADIYTLWPVDTETFDLYMKPWVLWLKWEERFHGTGKRPETHPYLPEDADEYRQLTGLLDE